MKKHLKSIVKATSANPFAWQLYKGLGWLSDFSGKVYGYAKHTRPPEPLSPQLLEFSTRLFPDLKVANGPFKGLKYPTALSVGSAFLPKLLGSYESELHPVLNKMSNNLYETVVDIGCAEGYYAIGSALMFPQADVYAFDTDPAAKRLCGEMAQLNGVDNRVHVGDFCDEKILRSIPLGQKALVISDCEGFESSLFTEEIARTTLRPHDVIIETHDFIDIEISTKIRAAFSGTHDVLSVKSADDIEKAHHYFCPALAGFGLHDRYLILREQRPAIMEWLVLSAKKAA